MILSIVIDFPFWFILFCIATGFSYALLLYFRNSHEDFPRWLNAFMGVIRFVTVSIIAFLLLSPLIKSVTKSYDNPVILIVQDNSQSILLCSDSVYYRTDYIKSLSSLYYNLAEDYDVKAYTFGERFQRVDEGFLNQTDFFEEKLTDFSILFKDIENRYANRNVGALIIATDGIYNQGLDPLYAMNNIKFPVYTLALGDTNLQKDVILSGINYNKIAYLGNKFPVEVIIKANELNGNRSKLSISRGGKVVFSKYIDFTDDNFVQSVLVEIEAEESGLQRYRVQLSVLEEEVSADNNRVDMFIDVLDARQRILLLYDAPHPDVSALKQAIKSNYHFQVEDYPAKDFFEPVSDYDLIILHQIPALNRPYTSLLSNINKARIPAWFILSSGSAISSFNELNTGLTIHAQNANYNEALPVMNNNFVLFELPGKTIQMLEEAPPLIAPFGQYKPLPTANILLYQRIGKVTTEIPLLLFNQEQERRTGITAGEGIWRWRLFNYLQNEDHQAFNGLINRIIQYLSVRDDKRYFRIISKNRFIENEPVTLNAEVYNKSYELINAPEVELEILDMEHNRFSYAFGRKGKGYVIDAGIFPVGSYSYTARVTVGNDIYTEQGEFLVESMIIEKINTVANHNLLFNLARKGDGEMLFPHQMEQFADLLKDRGDIKTITFSQKRYNELTNIIWVLILIIGLLSVEWFIRKYQGSY